MRLIAENFAQNIIYCIFKKPCPLLRRQDFLVIQYTAVHMLLSFCWDCMLTLHICLVKKKMSIFCRFLSMSTTNAPNKKTFKKEKDNKGWMGPNSVSTVLVRLYNCPLHKKTITWIISNKYYCAKLNQKKTSCKPKETTNPLLFICDKTQLFEGKNHNIHVIHFFATCWFEWFSSLLLISDFRVRHEMVRYLARPKKAVSLVA